MELEAMRLSNNSIRLTALRAAADTGRSPARLRRSIARERCLSGRAVSADGRHRRFTTRAASGSH